MKDQLPLLGCMKVLFFHKGIPSNREAATYAHIIRWLGDPEETLGRGRGRSDDDKGRPKGRESTHWRKTDDVATYKRRILELMQDGEVRTFNSICVALTGTTADVWLDAEPDVALWKLVAEEKLAWANSPQGCIFFSLVENVKWPK